MKTTIKLSLPPNSKTLVEVGDHVNPKTPLLQTPQKQEEKTIHLARLLEVPSSSIYKYLTKQVGEEVSSGDVLAKKDGFFNSSLVKSPINGKIKEIDLKKGTLTLLNQVKAKPTTIISPTEAKVVAVSKYEIELEIEGQSAKAVKGEGKEVIGDLVYFPGEIVDFLDINRDVEGGVIVCQEINKDALVKLEVVGAAGFILKKGLKDTNFPWVQVDMEDFSKLCKLAGRKVFLRPRERQIVILE